MPCEWLDGRKALDEPPVRDRLIERVRRAQIGLQRFALDVLIQAPTGIRVRENGDGKVPLRYDFQQQDMSAQRAAVRCRADRANVAQMPRDADVVVGALLVRLRRTKTLQRFARQYAFAVRGGAVAHVKAGVREQVGHADANTARCDAGRWRKWPVERGYSVARGMSRGKPLDNEFSGCRASVLQAERLKYQVSYRAIDGCSGDDLDDAARNAEPRVVVTPRRPRGRDLHQIGDRRDEVRERLGAALGAGHLTLPAAHVRQQMPHRHVATHRFVAHAEVRQVRTHRCPEIDLALLDEPHHRGRGERLGDGRDGEDGVRRDWQRIFDIRDAESANAHGAVAHDAEGDAGHAILLHLRLGERDQRLELRVGAGLGAQRGAVGDRDQRSDDVRSHRWPPSQRQRNSCGATPRCRENGPSVSVPTSTRNTIRSPFTCPTYRAGTESVTSPSRTGPPCSRMCTPRTSKRPVRSRRTGAVMPPCAQS